MIQNAKFSGYYFYMNTNLWRDFQICISVPLKECDICQYCFFYIKGLGFNRMSAMDARISINLKGFVVFNIRGVNYFCNIYGSSKIDV